MMMVKRCRRVRFQEIYKQLKRKHGVFFDRSPPVAMVTYYVTLSSAFS